MATTISNLVAIPGLHTMPNEADLAKATLAQVQSTCILPDNVLQADLLLQSYNMLPNDRDQPEISETHLKEISELIIEHGVEGRFGIHLAHGHLKMDDGQVMFGKALVKIRGYWTRPTNISELDLSNMHGHIFVLDSNCQFHPYEYRQGAPPPMNTADDAFVTALAKYLQTRRLTTLVGLQVLNEDKTKQMQEFVLGENNGAFMLDANDTNMNEAYRVTGFAVAADQPGGISELKGNETHSPTARSTHHVFTDGKALPNEESIVDVLQNDGIIGRG